EVGASQDRVAADADAGGLAGADGGGLVHGFVGQGAGLRDHADLALFVDVAVHDADFALFRGDDARAVGADEHHVRVLIAQDLLGAGHVEHGHAFGDADDGLYARISGL